MYYLKHNTFIFTSFGLVAYLLPHVLLAALPDAPNSIGTNPQTIVEYRVVGVTDTATNWTAAKATDSQEGTVFGIGAMNRLCQAEVHPQSHMASTSEWVGTPEPHLLIPEGVDEAWLLPSPRAYPDTPKDYPIYVMDIDFDSTYDVHPKVLPPLAQRPPTLTCTRANSPAVHLYGAAGSHTGRVGYAHCSRVLPVACAAPVSVTVGP